MAKQFKQFSAILQKSVDFVQLSNKVNIASNKKNAKNTSVLLSCLTLIVALL
jgi:hypothetical protein